MSQEEPAPAVLRIESVILTVVLAAGLGLVLGAVFGYGAGTLAPGFFKHLLTSPGHNVELEPVATATMMGAFGGVMLGGCLGAFAVLMHVASKWIAARTPTGA